VLREKTIRERTTMKIGIIGVGNMGAGLGKLWASRHNIFFSFSRDAEKPAQLAQSIGGTAQAGSVVEAVRFADIVLVAVPWPALKSALLPVQAELIGKPLITCVSPLRPDFTGQTTGIASPIPISGAEYIAQHLAPGSRVVEAFNLTFAEVLAGGAARFSEGRATVPYVGDDTEAKCMTASLITDAGYAPLDAGSLERARVLEPLATGWVQFAAATGLFPQIGLQMLREVRCKENPEEREK
jgi:8-hydroxy-5-deazaflavin:NADPH oxidoreductase